MGKLDGQATAVFGGGDGWLYALNISSSNPDDTTLRWRFNCNIPGTIWAEGGRGNRNYLVSSPIIVGDHVYAATGRKPDDGDGASQPHPIAQLLKVRSDGRAAWTYHGMDADGDGRLDERERLHRTIGRIGHADGLVIVADLAGLVHAVDDRTGRGVWVVDMGSGSWAGPVVSGRHIYLADETGRVTIMALGREARIVNQIDMETAILAPPALHRGVLYIATRTHLFAIGD